MSSASDTGPASTDGAKSKRVSRACEPCSLSRRKCDGCAPCAYCVKTGRDCQYPAEPPKKRGPKEGSKRKKTATENPPARAAPSSSGRIPVPEPAGTELLAGKKRTRQESKTVHGEEHTTEEEASAVGIDALLKPPADLLRKAAAAKGPSPVPGSLSISASSSSSSSSSSAGAGHPPLSIASELTVAALWAPPGPIVPSADELHAIDQFFSYYNAAFPAVDEDYYRAALEEARYYLSAPDNENAQAGGASSSSAAASKPSRKELSPLQRNSEAYGFRVLHHMVLCIGYNTLRNAEAAKSYYDLATAYLAPCFNQPSLHLASALLLLVGATRALVPGQEQQAALHASLALRMCELVEAPPEVYVCSEILACGCSSPEAIAAASSSAGFFPKLQWPPAVADASTPWYKRAGQICGFQKLLIMTDFESVTEDRLAEYRQTREEAKALIEQHGIMKQMPYHLLILGSYAMLNHKFGKATEAYEYACSTLEQTYSSPLAPHFVPSILLVSKLLPIIQSRPSAKSASLVKRGLELLLSSPLYDRSSGPFPSSPDGTDDGAATSASPSSSSSSSTHSASSRSSSELSAAPAPAKASQKAVGAPKLTRPLGLAPPTGTRKPPAPGGKSLATSKAVEMAFFQGFLIPSGPGALLPLGDDGSSVASGKSSLTDVILGARRSLATGNNTGGGKYKDNDDDDSILGTGLGKVQSRATSSSSNAAPAGGSGVLPGLFSSDFTKADRTDAHSIFSLSSYGSLGLGFGTLSGGMGLGKQA